MHRTVPGALITALIALSVLRALQVAQGLADGAASLRALTLVAVAIAGVLALRALVGAAARAQAHVAVWAASIVAHLLLADVAAGFLRPGLTERLLATAFICAILGAIVGSVPRIPTRSAQAEGATAPSIV